MPSVQSVVVHVGWKEGGDGLGKEGVDEHGHGPDLDIEDTQPSCFWLPVHHYLLRFDKKILVEPSLNTTGYGTAASHT